ncbi:MAG: NAD(P)H-hydrate dehydratase, partial [Pirellulales bacterium]|nr:NAD(P)H-hydrate dehydratase [Pirellulales bacterium]
IAALRTGSGLVTAAVPDRCLETVASFHPAIMTIPLTDDGRGRFSPQAASELPNLLDSPDAIGCGPGMTTQPGSIRLVERIVQATSIPKVLDADAINALAMLPQRSSTANQGPLVLTPHPGEFFRLTGVSPASREAQIVAAQQLTASSDQTAVVLKGGPTVVISNARIWTNTTGNPGMATAGSGDVLTGVITSLLGQGMPAWDAARLGVWIHGRAGDLAARRVGQPGLTAMDLCASIAEAAANCIDSDEAG